MERLTKRNSEGAVILAKGCHYGCEYLTCHIEEGYQCNHQCEADIVCKLSDYEDAEEQGLLLRLPCKVGDTVYWVYDCRMIREVIVYGFRVTPSKILMLDYSQFPFGNIGVDVFLTKEDAEQALKQMGE